MVNAVYLAADAVVARDAKRMGLDLRCFRSLTGPCHTAAKDSLAKPDSADMVQLEWLAGPKGAVRLAQDLRDSRDEGLPCGADRWPHTRIDSCSPACATVSDNGAMKSVACARPRRHRGRGTRTAKQAVSSAD